MAAPQILWFRQDLRLSDHRPLLAAQKAGPVVPVYVLDDETPGSWKMGAAQRWWLHHSLVALGTELKKRGSSLLLLRGRAGSVLPKLAAELRASDIHAHRLYEPWGATQEAETGAHLDLHLQPGETLAPPDTVLNGSGRPYKVFTPFWHALREKMPPPRPLPAPERLQGIDRVPQAGTLEEWALRPAQPDWASGFSGMWLPGASSAHTALARFTAQATSYGEGRNLPAEARSSALSPHLHMGEVSPAEVWHAVSDAAGAAAEPFLRELGWRDFALQQIDATPWSADQSVRPQFAQFPHRDAPAELRLWQRGRTGYPIVDAGMRQLWATGWMHNRVRMVAASFLVKHLLIDWRHGARWFWDCLVDADIANNTLGWQWIMGSGADAQPFFRIFDPVAQGQRHDPAGAYVRRWVPELAELPERFIHAPWAAPPETLAAAGVRLGATYPERVVEHGVARRRALDAYSSVKDG